MSGLSGKGIFPDKEDDFSLYGDKAVLLLLDPANATRFNISAARKTAITNKWNRYKTLYGKTNQLSKKTRTSDDIADRVAARADVEAELSATYADIPKSNLTTADRSILNLKLRSAATPTPIPTTQPQLLRIETSIRLQHGLYFKDSVLLTKAKPKGVRACEFWFFIAPAGAAAPTDIDQYRFLAQDSESPYIASFKTADIGKSVWYIFRWINTLGQPGPWSAPVMATITG